jgi:predicted NAD/FAD-binding protein
MDGQPQWLTVDGGAQQYVQRLAASLKSRALTGCPAVSVTRRDNGVDVVDANGRTARYDHVVFACHTDESLALLADATDAERSALAAIKYQRNLAILHKDPRFMPKRKRIWAAWNYHASGEGAEPAVTLTYWMNKLQSIDERYPLFVTLNPATEVAAEDIFDTYVFHHPVFDTAAVAAQSALKQLQGERHTWFCGAYMRHGFHEDGLVSAMAVAERLGVTAPWIASQAPQVDELAAAAS